MRISMHDDYCLSSTKNQQEGRGVSTRSKNNKNTIKMNRSGTGEQVCIYWNIQHLQMHTHTFDSIFRIIREASFQDFSG